MCMYMYTLCINYGLENCWLQLQLQVQFMYRISRIDPHNTTTDKQNLCQIDPPASLPYTVGMQSQGDIKEPFFLKVHVPQETVMT